MRTNFLALFTVLSLFGAVTASAETGEARGLEAETLYTALAQANSRQQAIPIEQGLFAHWAKTDSESVALIFEQVTVLMKEGALDEAKAKLDLLVKIAPSFVEGWSHRALIHKRLGQYNRAIADLRRALGLEPRHFRALALLGAIFSDLDDPKSALRAYEEAVGVNPQLEGGAEAVRRLTLEVKGRGI